ncbi:hypothetical protein ES703_110995 [subsurface metagenome]
MYLPAHPANAVCRPGQHHWSTRASYSCQRGHTDYPGFFLSLWNAVPVSSPPVDQLQCQDNPTFMAFGVKDRPGRLAISPRDFARFGLLYLRKGKWKGKQLISVNHATMAVTSPLPNSIPTTSGKWRRIRVSIGHVFLRLNLTFKPNKD